MITIISSTKSAHRIVKRLNKQKYQLLFLFSDYVEYKAFGDFEKIKVGNKRKTSGKTLPAYECFVII